MRKFLVISLLLLVTLASCSHDDENEVFIIVDQPGYTGIVQAGSKVVFDVNATSIEASLRSITVTEQSASLGRNILLDTSVNGKQVEFSFCYHVPELLSDDSAKVNLVFEACNVDGVKSHMTLVMTVSSGYPLHDASGVTLYSSRSGNPNGLMLATLQTVYVGADASVNADIYDYLDSAAADTTSMSLRWNSATDVLFARFNDFNFADASVKTLVDSYRASVHYSTIKDIKAGDIILVGREEQVIGAIQIVEVFDSPGVENDRYILNIKKL